jgi:hypothetical protein
MGALSRLASSQRSTGSLKRLITVATTDILDEGPFEIGQVVNAKYRNSAMYFSATVKKIIEDAIEVEYSKEEDPTPCFRLFDEDKKVIDITAADITVCAGSVCCFWLPFEPEHISLGC